MSKNGPLVERQKVGRFKERGLGRPEVGRSDKANFMESRLKAGAFLEERRAMRIQRGGLLGERRRQVSQRGPVGEQA